MFRSAEQARFSALVSQHIATGTAPLLLEGGTGLGKTRAYLHALVQSGKRVAIILPTHQLIDQLLASSDLAEAAPGVSVVAFRPARMHIDRAAYEEARVAARAAQVMLCTAASVIIDQRLKGDYTGATQREYILFDEADQLPDLAALQTDVCIPRDEQRALSIPAGVGALAVVAAILAKPARQMLPETRAAARVIRDALDDPDSKAYAQAGVSADGDVVLLHRLPGRLLKRVSNQANVAFVSATLSISGRFQDFQRAMGIGNIDGCSCQIEPARHGSLEFLTEAQTIDTPEWLAAVVQAVTDAPRPVLVVTPSHSLVEGLGACIAGAVMRGRHETASEAAKRVGPDGVLIAAAAWAGLDTPLRWRSIIVPRVPYPQVQTVNGDVFTSYIESRNAAVRRLRQVIGRGLRTPDAVCQVVILDDRVHNLTGFVPERFLFNWDVREGLEGGRRDVTRAEAKRLHKFRQAALKHYGKKCMAIGCTFQAKVDSQWEVHHRNPIAEGARKTKLEDLMVLCACCHRLAHSRNPPYQLDREMAP